MRDLSEIGLDSQCLSYLIDTLEGVVAPADRLAEQRVVLVALERVFQELSVAPELAQLGLVRESDPGDGGVGHHETTKEVVATASNASARPREPEPHRVTNVAVSAIGTMTQSTTAAQSHAGCRPCSRHQAA